MRWSFSFGFSQARAEKQAQKQQSTARRLSTPEDDGGGDDDYPTKTQFAARPEEAGARPGGGSGSLGHLRPPRFSHHGRSASDASSVSSTASVKSSSSWSSFDADIARGLSSPTFNLDENVRNGDGRDGLDGAATAEIVDLMGANSLAFDEARKVYMQRIFMRNCIEPDGMPDDPKLVCFSRPATWD